MIRDRLLQCRYYHGEKEYKGAGLDLFFWEAEMLYVESDGTKEEIEAVNFFFNCGLSSEGVGLPLELLAALFAIYCKGSDISPELNAKNFEENFLKKYLAHSLTEDSRGHFSSCHSVPLSDPL